VITDANGQFALKNLDPDLVFNLLAVKEGYKPAQTAKPADPKIGATKLTLPANDLDRRGPELVLKGRILDDDGKPVASAAVEPFGFGKAGGNSFRYGALNRQGFDELALTNDKGEFRLGVPEKGLAVSVRVSAPRMARRNFDKLSCGPSSNGLTLFYGVTVVGRLLKDGKPLAGAGVGVVQTDRSATNFVGDLNAATDDKGTFRVPNIPPNDVFLVYGLMDTLKDHGAVPVRPVKSGKSGTELDLGDIAVQPGLKLTGKIVLADGKPVPAGTRVMLSRVEAWDHQEFIAGPDGTFEFKGLPSERYSLTTHVPGYIVSPKNASFERLNRGSLVGVIKTDTANLRFLLEKGARSAPNLNIDRETSDEYFRRRKAPLCGAPESDSGGASGNDGSGPNRDGSTAKRLADFSQRLNAAKTPAARSQVLLDDAVKEFQAAGQEPMTEPHRLLADMAGLQDRLGDRDAARKLFDQAIAMVSAMRELQQPAELRMLAQAAAKAGEVEEAIATTQRIPKGNQWRDITFQEIASELVKKRKVKTP
jgi:hypothetical protein